MRADLALVGFGRVARRFVTLLDEQRHTLAAYGVAPRILGIVTQRHGGVFDENGIDAAHAVRLRHSGRTLASGTDAGAATFDDLLTGLARSTAPLRVLIEATTLSIADGEPAVGHVERALLAGCHVVTVNKGPAAFAYRRLAALAEQQGVSFLFEGAVMDGVPIFNLVRETLPGVQIRGFRGVVNSTTNYVLSALEDGEAFAPSLARMQAEGIAEADPSLDLDGWDAAAKTAALANVLMDAGITPHDVERTGIDAGWGDRAAAARSRGSRVRLVASAARDAGGRTVARVAPAELGADDPLWQLRGPANALVLSTDLLGDVAIHQLGGDLTMTAYALLTDLIAVARRAALRSEGR